MSCVLCVVCVCFLSCANRSPVWHLSTSTHKLATCRFLRLRPALADFFSAMRKNEPVIPFRLGEAPRSCSLDRGFAPHGPRNVRGAPAVLAVAPSLQHQTISLVLQRMCFSSQGAVAPAPRWPQPVCCVRHAESHRSFEPRLGVVEKVEMAMGQR